MSRNGFLPVDAKLLSAEQAATALNYARSCLKNDNRPLGGTDGVEFELGFRNLVDSNRLAR